MSQKAFKCFDRRWLFQLGGAMGLGLVFGFVARGFERGTAMRIGLVAAEVLCFGVGIAITVLVTRKLDELGRRIQLEGIAISFTATAILATALSLLQNAAGTQIDWEEWIWPFMAVVWAVSTMIINRRYQ